MSTLEQEVREEIEELHRFFVRWFNGTIEKETLDDCLTSHLHPTVNFIPPEGRLISRDDIVSGFRQGYGSNPNFRIQIRDVKVRYEMEAHLLATYTEWQISAKASEQSQNARFTSVLMTKQKPFQWLHIQETWLPEDVRAADPFDF